MNPIIPIHNVEKITIFIIVLFKFENIRVGRSAEKIIITPHIGGATKNSMSREASTTIVIEGGIDPSRDSQDGDATEDKKTKFDERDALSREGGQNHLGRPAGWTEQREGSLDLCDIVSHGIEIFGIGQSLRTQRA